MSHDTMLAAPEIDLERHRVELTGYCYRMLGSSFEAEDAVQETLTRAWRGLDRFERRAALRTWLYRIASNVCLDMLSSAQRRARPMDLTGAESADAPLRPPLPETAWVLPVPDGRVIAADDPAEQAIERDTIRLAFVAALQHLPPRQRAVLILREVLRFDASEVATQLETSVPSVNSALQRARATLATLDVDAAPPSEAELDDAQRALLERYVDAFERYDIAALTTLLQEDVIQSMPPYDHWLQGRDELFAWWQGPGIACKGSRLLPTRANGRPAFGQYRPSPGGGYHAWALQILEVHGDRIGEFTFFLDVATLFPLFGLPPTLPA